MPFDPINASTTAWPACTPEAVAEIIDGRDLALRNLAITQSYHQLTREVGQRMGTRDITWTGFAVWASKTAGTFIRRDWLPPGLYERLLAHAGPATTSLERLDHHLANHVARGNCMAYAEIGPLFVELIEVLDTPLPHREARTQRALERLRPGSVQTGGQAPLARALRAYLEAARCDDERRRAQLVLLGNLLIGFQEQWRLQPEIRACLDAVWTVLPQPRAPWQQALQRGLAAGVRRALTQVMTIRTPRAPLRLGRDLPRLADGHMFAPVLEHIDHPELRRLLATFDRTPNTVEGSAARDWADLDDRMNYLVDLFRSRQRDPDLWAPPFRAAQVRALARAQLPRGEL